MCDRVGKNTVKRPEYLGKPLTYSRLAQIIRTAEGYTPEEPLSVSRACAGIKSGGLGLYHPINLLAKARGISTDQVLRKAGIKTHHSDVDERTSDAYLRGQLIAYISKTGKPIGIRALVSDKEHGGAKLASALQTLARRRNGKGTISIEIERLLRKNLRGTRFTFEKAVEEVRAFYPRKCREQAYFGSKPLRPLSEYRSQHPAHYAKISSNGWLIDVLRKVDPEFPDLYRKVSSALGSTIPADPALVLRQLEHRIRKNHPINPSIKGSPNPVDRNFARDVLSLRKIPEFKHCLTYADVIKKLRPSTRTSEIRLNSVEKIRLLGKLGNLFVCAWLGLTYAVDRTGNFYSNGFKKKFGAPIDAIISEKRACSQDGRFHIPDLFLIGRSNIGIEVKTGESPNQLNIAAKQCTGNGHTVKHQGTEYLLDRHHAVLVMPSYVSRLARRRLNGTSSTDAKELRVHLKELFAGVDNNPGLRKMACELAPRPHNLNSLLVLFDLLAENPPAVFKRENRQMVDFGTGCLEEIVHNLKLRSYLS